MKNFWLDEIKYKRIFGEIEQVLTEVWSEEGILADVFNALTEEQTRQFLGMSVGPLFANADSGELEISLNK